jgi:hypothetical protein
MVEYKRNQVEEAISRATYPEDVEPGADLLTKLKRLLDTDRNLGRDPRSVDPEQRTYAFYSEEASGSGVEVKYSPYEALALHIAFQMLIHGCPQALAVSILRKARPKLEPRHVQMLRWGPSEPSPDKFLFLVSVSRRDGDVVTRQVDVLDRTQLERFLLSRGAGQFVMQIEVARTAWLLDRLLQKTTPKKRGRGSA